VEVVHVMCTHHTAYWSLSITWLLTGINQ